MADRDVAVSKTVSSDNESSNLSAPVYIEGKMKLKKLSIKEAKNFVGKEIYFWSESDGYFSNIYKGILNATVEYYSFMFIIKCDSKEMVKKRVDNCGYSKSTATCFEFCGIVEDNQLEFNF